MQQVCEYATLTTDPVDKGGLERVHLSDAAFNWLLDFQLPGQSDKKLAQLTGRDELKLGSYVGYLEAPTGECLEILPKTERSAPGDVPALRLLLQKMLRISLNIQPREVRAADLLSMRQPLHEWIFASFLTELTELVKKGLRFDYHTKEDECSYVRGRLDINRQMRKTPDKAASFHVRYDEFSPDRIENRLLRTALDFVLKHTHDHQNWRLANALSHQLADIAPLANPLRQMQHWATSKFLLPYRKVRPWCNVIIEKLNPNFQQGNRRGIALLFPMEQLYEQYLGHCLGGSISDGCRLVKQAASQYLVRHAPPTGVAEYPLFQLNPDFLITGLCGRFVLDAKWKLLDARATDGEKKYGISQSDLYQLFAYGEKYQEGKGHMMLIYPRHAHFPAPLPAFRYNDRLSLWCVPFDMDNGKLVAGEWQAMFDCFTGHVARAELLYHELPFIEGECQNTHQGTLP